MITAKEFWFSPQQTWRKNDHSESNKKLPGIVEINMM